MKKIIALSLALIMGLSCFSLVSFAEDTDTVEHLTEVPDGYVGIYNKDDLDNIKLDMSGKYILMNDIVFEDSDYVKGGSFYNSGKGWEPIGTTSTPFEGILDGNNYRIKNLYINNPTQDYIGLFGCVSYATINNIILEDANITGGNCVGGVAGYVGYSTVTNVILKNISLTGNDYVGGVVGYSYRTTTVSYCNVLGSVNGINNVGGIVGYQTTYKNAIESTTYNYIVYCNNGAQVTAKSNVGGIVGYSTSYVKRLYKSSPVTTSGAYYYYYEYSYIKNCSNSGDIVASDSMAGGIVGQMYNHRNMDEYADIYIECCYNCGDISAPSYVGGLAGKCYTEVSKFKHCYSVGEITGSDNFGGCFGDTPKTATFCYYLDEVVTNPTCTAGIAKSEDQLKKQTAYEQWDFVNTWTMAGREDYPYPELRDVALVFPEDNSHKHEYTSEITTPATHLAEGVMTYTCECGDTYTEGIAKITGHSYVAVITAPTCTAKGYTTYTCECGDTYVDDYVDAKGHSFDAIVSAPTCTKYGYTTYVCLCGENYVGDYVSVKGHVDNNGDYICDYNCGFVFEKIDTSTPDTPSDSTDSCACNCHKGGLAGLFFKLINFFQKLFGMNKVCACGVKH